MADDDVDDWLDNFEESEMTSTDRSQSRSLERLDIQPEQQVFFLSFSFFFSLVC